MTADDHGQPRSTTVDQYKTKLIKTNIKENNTTNNNIVDVDLSFILGLVQILDGVPVSNVMTLYRQYIATHNIINPKAYFLKWWEGNKQAIKAGHKAELYASESRQQQIKEMQQKVNDQEITNKIEYNNAIFSLCSTFY